MTHPLTDPIALLRALLAANWQRLLASAPDPDERDEDAIAHLDASRWLDAAGLRATGDASGPTPAEQRADAREREVELERRLTAMTRDRDEFRGLAGARLDALCHLGAGRPVPAQTRAAVGMFAHDPLDAIASRLADLAATRSELTATARRCDVLRAALAALAAGRPVDHVAAEAAGADTHAIDAIAERLARIDAQPAQCEASGGAGVDWRGHFEGVCNAMDSLAASIDRCGDHRSAVDIRATIGSLRRRAREAQRSADEAHQRGERVGEVVRVVVAEGVARRQYGACAEVGGEAADVGVIRAVREYDGRRVRVVVEVLEGAGHGAKIAAADGDGKAHAS